MKAIVCVDKNWAIGRDGNLLVSIPGDQRFFRETTMGGVIVMGRRTLDSLPGGRVLDGRKNIILTRNPNLKVKGGLVVHGKDELLDHLKQYSTEEIYVIGGSKIYDLLLPYCDTAYVTMVNYTYQADTWFTNLDCLPEWELVSESEEEACFDIDYTFRTYKKRYHTSWPE